MESSQAQLIIGRKPVLDALQNGDPVSSIWIDRSLRGPEEIKVRQAAKEESIPLKRVSKLVLDKKTKANHQGVIAYTSPIRFADMENVINHVFAQGEVPLFLYLDRVQDVGNFGSIVRTAEVMGVHAIIIPAQKMAPVNDQVVKISTGAVFHIPICRVNNVQDTLQLIQNFGIRIMASSLSGKTPIQEIDLTVPSCMIVGSEDTGISVEIEEVADELFIIPQFGQTESLNAAVATGMMLYETSRQRRF